jgi:hypothetical protein
VNASAKQEKSGGLENVNHLLDVLSNSKMSQMRLKWENLAERSKRYYKRKADEGIHCVLEFIAPGHAQQLNISKMQSQVETTTDMCSNNDKEYK